MQQLHINLKNCYGIGEMNSDIKFGKGKNACVIYAPNGTMKTSFTKTVLDLLENKQPQDKIFKDRIASASIMLDGKPISIDNCYVFDNQKDNGYECLSTLLANKQLKERYDAILQRLTDSWNSLRKKLATDSRSSDCEDEILKTFSNTATTSIFECLLSIYKTYFSTLKKSFYHYTFKYNNVFDKAGKVEKFVADNIKSIEEYFKSYKDVIKDSNLFTEGEDSFGTYQIVQLIKSVEDDRFFKASHKIVLKGGKQITSKDTLSDVYENEINRILGNEKLRQAFNKIDKKLQGNAELRTFKETIQQNPFLIPLLLDYEKFRREVLLGYLYNNITEFKDFIHQYNKEKIEILKIINEANQGIAKWNDVISLFNARFFVPFEVFLKNQSDMILKEQAATLGFRYRDDEDAAQEETQNELLSALSLGEKRAFYILQNLFEIESRKTLDTETLIICDDIADSFDYKNKYAIIEYLADLIGYDKFILLILTHNFDFYRTVASRLECNKVYLANRTPERKIELCQGICRPDIIKNRFISKIEKKRQFVGLIPFVRNLIEYTDGASSTDYILLTSCLHQKPDTESIKIETIYDVFKSHLSGLADKNISFMDEKYTDVLFGEAEAVLSDTNEVELANKLILSMAIRLKAETLMKSIVSEEHQAEMKLNNNQTGGMLKVLKKYCADKYPDVCLLMNRVLMLTSENIHFNNFMFEPLVDISSLHLKKLYEDVCNQIETYEYKTANENNGGGIS